MTFEQWIKEQGIFGDISDMREAWQASQRVTAERCLEIFNNQSQSWAEMEEKIIEEFLTGENK